MVGPRQWRLDKMGHSFSIYYRQHVCTNVSSQLEYHAQKHPITGNGINIASKQGELAARITPRNGKSLPYINSVDLIDSCPSHDQGISSCPTP